MSTRYYVLSSNNPLHWIGLKQEFPNAKLLCSPNYGAEFLRENKDVIASSDGFLAVFFDEDVEELIEDCDVPLCFPSTEVRNAIENKCEAVRIAQEAGVRLAPTALSRVRSYPHLRRIAELAGLGGEIVVQTPSGNSGKNTFCISNRADYQRYAAIIEEAAECRIMARVVNPQSICIETVNTESGVIVGMPALDLVGIPELTPNPNGWCGNVIGVIPDRVVDYIRSSSWKIATTTALRHPTYFGYSGDDYLLGAGEYYPVYQEKNARITGMVSLSNIAALELGIPPLLEQHIAQFEGREADIRVDYLNDAWSEVGKVGVTSCLIVKQLEGMPSEIMSLPCAGTYALDFGGVRHLSDSIEVEGLLAGFGQALWIPETTGKGLQPQDVLGRLLVREVVTDGKVLNPRGKAWVQAIRNGIKYY